MTAACFQVLLPWRVSAKDGHSPDVLVLGLGGVGGGEAEVVEQAVEVEQQQRDQEQQQQEENNPTVSLHS